MGHNIIGTPADYLFAFLWIVLECRDERVPRMTGCIGMGMLLFMEYSEDISSLNS
jgi:hypothetical protein